MKKMIVKVCGMSQAENIREIEKLAVDWMGFIFAPHSPRFLDKKPDYLPVKTRRVGVFVNAELSEILHRADDFKLWTVQLHGSESPIFCSELRTRSFTVIKAFQIETENDLRKTADYEGSCDYFLFDTKSNTYGGSGKLFDWTLLHSYQGQTPFLLSGGIGPENIIALKAFNHPLCVGIDLNSRFEILPGLKDGKAIKQFLKELLY